MKKLETSSTKAMRDNKNDYDNTVLLRKLVRNAKELIIKISNLNNDAKNSENKEQISATPKRKNDHGKRISH